jgi:hypothetical protein
MLAETDPEEKITIQGQKHKNFFDHYCHACAIKRSILVLCLWERPGAYPRVEHLKH